MEVEIRYFAAAREATGVAAERLPLPAGSTVAAARDALLARHPALAGPLPTLRFALDEAFAGPETALHDGAVLALIPPVGGG